MRTARNIVAGALGGLGVVVLLQQYAVAYPTGLVTIIGVLAGIAVQFGTAQLGGARPQLAMSAAETTPDVDDGSWVATHTVPATGLDAWAAPDASEAPQARLDAGLGVRVAAVHGDWAQILCENGWSAWVDGRALEARS